VAESNKEVHLFNGRIYRNTILCRSMEKPGEIVGFKIGHAQIDELDVLKREKARSPGARSSRACATRSTACATGWT
jgi:hypothetical protein